MDRFVIRGTGKEQEEDETGEDWQSGKEIMASESQTGQMLEVIERGKEATVIEESCSQQSTAELGDTLQKQLYAHGSLNFKQLAKEMALYLAEDLKQAVADMIQATTKDLQNKVTHQEQQLQEAEQRISEAEDKVIQLEKEVNDLKKQSSYTMDKLEDLENRSRRSNLKLIGLPESINTQQLNDIFEVELPKELGLPYKCRVERAHRIGPPRESPEPGGGRNRQNNKETQRPRQSVAKYLNFKDKEEILRAYKGRRRPLIIQGHKILLFGDFSAEVTQKRRAFSEICTLLFRRNIRFQLSYPATLRFKTREGMMCSYTDPKEAMECISQQRSASGQSSPGNASPPREVVGDDAEEQRGKTCPYRLRSEIQTEGDSGKNTMAKEQSTTVTRSFKKNQTR